MGYAGGDTVLSCDRPIKAYQGKRDPVTGKLEVTLVEKPSSEKPLSLPCGSCDGCRLDNAKQWALRAMHEAAMHEDNCFITLTYDDEHLPINGTLVPKHLEKFWKLLRINLQRSGLHSGKIRYLACGEYGDHTGRPHYHAIIFGFWPPALELWSERDGYKLYRSGLLESVWRKGNVLVGSVTPETTSYVARYALKKAGGPLIERDHPFLFREFRTVSRRPGLGRSWLSKYADDVKKDRVLLQKGVVSTVPRYYLNKMESLDVDSFLAIKQNRSDRAEQARLKDPHNLTLPAKIANRNARLALSRGAL